VPLGGAVDLDATVRNSGNNEVRWELVGDAPGRITEDGAYFAPDSLPTPHVVQVRATSLADPTKTLLQTIHIPPVLVRAPKEVLACSLNGSVQLLAKTENAENDRLAWSVEGGEACGTVSETGLYHPPASITTPAVVRVRAASVADPTKHAVMEVNIPEVRLSVSPGKAEVRPGRSIRLRPRVLGCGTGSAEVVWKLSPEIGSISPDGVYYAPENGGPQVVQIIAALKADPTKTATTTLRLRGR
jgi:hypothetical protein